MLNKVNRLKKRYQFNYIYKNGTHISSSAMVLYFLPSKTRSIKVGFAVTKKIGKATVRNLVKRRLREIVRNSLPNLKQNYNIIVVAKDNITNAKFDELANEFRKLTKKAELIKNEESI